MNCERSLPDPWRFVGRTTDGGAVWIAPVGTQPPGPPPRAIEAQ